MHEVGIGPSDGVMGVRHGRQYGQRALGEATGPVCSKGMKGTTPETDVGDKFRARLKKVDPKLIDFNYAGESYDAVVISRARRVEGQVDQRQGYCGEHRRGHHRWHRVHDVQGVPRTARRGGRRSPAEGSDGQPCSTPLATRPRSYSVREFGRDNKLGDPKFVVVQAQ